MEPDEYGALIRRQLKAYCRALERRSDPDDIQYPLAMFREFYRELKLTAVRIFLQGQAQGPSAKFEPPSLERMASGCGVTKQAFAKWVKLYRDEVSTK